MILATLLSSGGGYMSEDKKSANKAEKTEAPAADEAKPAGGGLASKLTTTHLIIIGVAGFMVCFITALFVLLAILLKPAPVADPAKSETPAANDAAKSETKADDANKKTAEHGEKKEGGESEAGKTAAVDEKKALFLKVDPPFIVNFDEARSAKFLQVTIEIMVRNDADLKSVENLLPIIKNDMIKLLSAQSFEELKTTRGKELLRTKALQTIQAIMNTEFGRPVAENVLFTTFVMQ